MIIIFLDIGEERTVSRQHARKKEQVFRSPSLVSDTLVSTLHRAHTATSSARTPEEREDR